MIKGYLAAAILAGVVGTGVLAPVTAMAEEGAKAASVRPEVGKPVQSALDLLKSKKTKEALAKLKDAEAVKDRSPYEVYLVERVKAQVYATSGDSLAAARAFESAAALPGAPAGERASLVSAAAGQYYSGRDYAKASAIAGRAIKEGAADASLRTIYVQSMYLSGDFANTAKTLSADIRAEEQAQRKPSEEQLQMLATAYLKLNDQANYAKSVQKLLSYYPKKEYWQSVIYEAKQHGGLGDRLGLDLARLQRATGTIKTSAEYEDAVALALQAGYPIEAKKALDEGLAAKIMGQGADADRHRRLGDMTNKQLAEDKQQLGSQDAQAIAAKDGTAQVNLGFNYVLHGQADKGLAMMEAGIAKGGLKRPDDAKLRLGYAYYLAGKKAKAVQTMKTVSGTDGAAALAGLWAIFLSQNN
ncbi:hypothetical protein GCM10025771_40280 [Niveibacterium umoris]|uniref:Tetratricopeptide repeat protein n=1 Tax=Niveibacterium umoris TaxID=1193620 RepID=A0A840BGL5_9RHOO|nr:hypothetical protein [Niveibacterium umoris]MBB4010769.1 hypothetical protein [Niveibacterium umoris]